MHTLYERRRMRHGKPAILAEGLEKSYGNTRALAGLNLEVEEGTVLGPSGPRTVLATPYAGSLPF